MKRLRIANFLGAGVSAHLARVRYGARSRMELHAHDFAEICWVESGRALISSPEGEEAAETGDLFIVLPADIHGYRTLSGTEFRLANIAFPAPFIEQAAERYPRYFGHTAAERRFSLSPASLARMIGHFDALKRGRATALAVDRFILETLGEIEESLAPESLESSMPAWLLESTARFLSAERPSAKPVEELARISGRTREHVSRVIARTADRAASDWLRENMLEKAAELLVLGDEDVALIAERARFANLAGFYRSFKVKYGATPAAYRRRGREPVAGR